MSRDREAMARIIEPELDAHLENMNLAKCRALVRLAYERADAILALPSDGDGWRPIEDAPKDGTAIRVQTYEVFRWLAYKPDGARQMKRAGRWQKHDGHGWANCPDPHGPWQPADAPSPSTHGEG